MEKTLDVDGMVKHIRENGIKVYLAPSENGSELNQATVRFMIERNLPRLRTEAKFAKTFADVSEQLEEVIEHA